jgi:hypothetical protein
MNNYRFDGVNHAWRSRLHQQPVASPRKAKKPEASVAAVTKTLDATAGRR